MNYGFVIDNRNCIGCHACSTACKAENEVPLGVYRTWVKYVEKGRFPDARRSFQVTRCNHCANPPCVRICPVTAMYQREDGIVEFDSDVCIGCKACLQACPYDAIHIDPNTGTAAKCHYCSHRTDNGLEPACVVVCPTQAIVSGDLDDPGSRISQLVARENVSVRKPEQGTAPKLFYIEGDASALNPTAALAPDALMWSDLVSEQAVRMPESVMVAGDQSPAPSQPASMKQAESGASIRSPQAQGAGDWPGPIRYGASSQAEHMVQVGYNAQHKVPWHWQVPAYLVTKAIGSGVFLWTVFLWMYQYVFHGAEFYGNESGRQLAITGNIISLIFIGITTALLVGDLERPSRFIKILTRPQWKSWLTRGAFILIGFSLVSAVWLFAELGLFGEAILTTIRLPLMLVGSVLAALTAMYTAWLFGQAEGRDLWQSPLLPVHLLVQALMAGAATLAGLVLFSNTVFLFLPHQAWDSDILFWSLPAILLIDLGLIFAEFGMPHSSTNAGRAAHELKSGKYSRLFKWGALGLGHVVPLVTLAFYTYLLSLPPSAMGDCTYLVASSQGLSGPCKGAMAVSLNQLGAGLSAGPSGAGQLILIASGVLIYISPFAILAGLYIYEHVFVMAPQEVPNS